MKIEIKVPAMGESISEATIGNILKPSGSQVKMDEEILELETDKVNQVLYAPQSGIVTYQVKPEDVVKIGQVIGFVDSESAAAPASPSQDNPSSPAKEVLSKSQKEPSLEPAPADWKGREGSTGARSSRESYLAALKSPDIPEIKTAPQGSQPAPSAPAAPTKPIPQVQKGVRNETRKKMSKIRKVIATRLVEVQQTTAMLTTFNEVDLTEVIALRDRYKDTFMKDYGVKLGFMSFFVKASVSALAAFPDINSYIEGDEIVHREYYDIGIAVGTEKGLIVPVVRNCDQLTFAGIESAIEGYAKKAREGTMTADDLQGGGFTVTNGGVYGSLLSTPILNPPQSAILGMHKIVKRPVAINDQVVIRPMMYLALSYDHRIVDGKEAVSFLVHIKNSLEDPARMLLEV